MKIIVWGTGLLAQTFIENGINGEVVCFLETEKRKNEYKGYPVYDIHSIPSEFDYIIVANRFSSEIYEICIKLKLDMRKVVFLKSESNVAFNHDKALRYILGEKNYTEYAVEFGILENTFFEDDMQQYSRMNTRTEFEIKKEYLWPIISEKYGMNSGMNEYFWQDLWAAKHIIAQGIKEHYDIGSRVDGFIAHLLAANIKVNMIDVRPFPGKAENLFTIVDDATTMSHFEDDSILSLSALCSLEHFGLGRYGDPVDPEACFMCFEQIQKKLRKGGNLYISVPVGQDKVVFNAHRIFYADTIIKCFNQLNLLEYSAIYDRNIYYNVEIHKYDNLEGGGHAVGLFHFKK